MKQKKFITPPASNSLIFKVLGITTLAFILSVALQAPFSASTSSIFSTPENKNFTISDIYAQIANNRPIRKLEDRIAIVDIGLGGRQEIAETLEILSLCGPAAIGLDINFEEPSEDDSRLLNALEATPGLILPLGVKPSGKGFDIDDRPFFYNDLQNAEYGVINLPTASAKSCVREFAVNFPSHSDTLLSFPVALAKIYDPALLSEIQARENSVETTAYHSKEFKIYSLDDIEKNAEDFTDKIVLVGSMSEAVDMHPTPINSYVPGLIIHASALSTILDHEWYTSLPKSFDYILAFVICMLIVWATVSIKGGVRGLIVRIIQIFLAYCAVRIGYSLFVDKNIICDFSNTLLMIAFGLFAVDIWNGGAALISMIRNRLKKT